MVSTSYEGVVISQVAVSIKREPDCLTMQQMQGLFAPVHQLKAPTAAVKSHGSGLCHQPLLLSSAFSLSMSHTHLLDQVHLIDSSSDLGSALNANKKALDLVGLAWSKSIESLILNHRSESKRVLMSLLPHARQDTDETSLYCLRKVDLSYCSLLTLPISSPHPSSDHNQRSILCLSGL